MDQYPNSNKHLYYSDFTFYTPLPIKQTRGPWENILFRNLGQREVVQGEPGTFFLRMKLTKYSKTNLEHVKRTQEPI